MTLAAALRLRNDRCHCSETGLNAPPGRARAQGEGEMRKLGPRPATGIVFMRLIATLLLVLCGLPASTAAQTVRPVALPTPSPFPASSVIYQWDYTCHDATADSVCFSSVGFPVTAVSLFLVEFPIRSSKILMSCYIATLTTQSASTGWNTSCTPATNGFAFSQRGMTLNYAGNPNAAPTPQSKTP